MRKTVLSVMLMGALGALGCSEANGPLSPNGDDRFDGPLAEATQLVCETMDFNGFNGITGEEVTSLALFDFNVSVSVTPGGAQSLDEARVFDTSRQDDTNDPDLQYPPEGLCANCQTQDLMDVLIIQQAPGFQPTLVGDMVPDDSRDGGIITFSGFAGQTGTFTLEEYKAVDDDAGEPNFDAFVDGGATSVGSSSATGDGTVETVSTGSTPFTTSFSIEYHSSGAVDDIRVCRETEQPGEEGCTLGFWGNRALMIDAWDDTDYSTTQTLEDVFNVPDAYGLDGVTLLDALGLTGGPSVADKAALLLKQAVAAILNATHPDVDYPATAADIIADVNAELASGNPEAIEDLKDQLDEWNNLGSDLCGEGDEEEGEGGPPSGVPGKGKS